jgi:hypothetical protein
MGIRELNFTWAYTFADRVIGEVRAPESPDVIFDLLEPREGSFLAKAARPAKKTLLHDFIHGLNISDLDYETGHYPSEQIDSFVSILRSANIESPPWLCESEVRGHIRALDALLDRAAEVITEATFHLLFSDREFLVSFQKLIAGKIRTYDQSTSAALFKKPNVLRRLKSLPSWLRRAVFLRDKGRCQICFCDLTGTLALDPKLHLDHIMPLASSGSNDPTNFQLLCESCNLDKSSKQGGHVFRTVTYW